jgi:3-isopropylmalate/(R)-2-methylmalate dehydratase large subunit
VNQTIVEKILSSHCGRNVYAGEVVLPSVDLAMATDGSGPLSIELLHQMGKDGVKNSQNVIMVIDHYVPCPNDKVARLLDTMRQFCKDTGCSLFDSGEGIGHQLLPERGYIKPGNIVVGADSHACTYGALNALGTGIGSSDLAAVMATGKLWFKVPETIRVELTGTLKENVTAKDLALHLVGTLGADGANYRALEFSGSGVATLDMDDRLTVCNMTVETGAKCGLMPFDETTQAYLNQIGSSNFTPVFADKGAEYEKSIRIDLDRLEIQVAAPHQVDNVHAIGDLAGTPIHMVVIGTCTNGRLKDLQVAAELLRQHPKAPGVELLIVPASQQMLTQAAELGLVEIFSRSGAMILPPGCGPCCGSSAGIPGDGKNVFSTANRNFLGRMGNINAQIYLGSPIAAASAAATGAISHPDSLNRKS